MSRDNDQFKVFSRRLFLLTGSKFALIGGLLGRLYYLQVVQSDKYKVLAEENRINIRLLVPPRGEIFDRQGRPLALNDRNFRVMLVPEQASSVMQTLDQLAELIKIDDKTRRRFMKELERSLPFVAIPVRDNLSWQDVARIEVNAPDLPGVHIEVGQTRTYPYAAYLAHVVGYVGRVSEQEVNKDPLLQLPDFRIGKNGLEKFYDQELRGKAGTREVEVNALGRVVRELAHVQGEPGKELKLTIDLDLQNYAFDRLEQHSGSVVVMNVHTGEVLTLASAPSYDPNGFNRGLAQEEWDALMSNPKAPLTNKSIAGLYAPGSTFKMCVALAALENGIVTPQFRTYCNGHMELGNSRFHCWLRDGHGSMDMVQALTESCDVYFYQLALKVGIANISAMARRFGLGEELGIDLFGEKSGVVPSRRWKLAHVGTSWQKGETLVAAIGQGYILTTPLQLAVMTARMVNGGFAVKPHLIKKEGDDQADTPRFPSLQVSAASLSVIQKALERVVNHESGTSFGSRVVERSMRFGGKTGTAQVRRISKSERDNRVLRNEELPWRQRDHALFVGYAPVDAPRYAVAVVLEHGGSGARYAAPIARDVLRKVQELERKNIPPGGPQDGDKNEH